MAIADCGLWIADWLSKPIRNSQSAIRTKACFWVLLLTASSAHAANFTYRGAAYVSWSSTDYQTPDSGASLTDLASTGANWASLLVTWYMPNKFATSIDADVTRTPSDVALIQAINDMHARGLRVMLKPHVDVNDGNWRGTIAPSDTDAWFVSYNTFVTHYAALAQSQGVDLFCIGCELKTMSGSANAARWQTVIQNIRSAYTGPLTYAANAYQVGDEYLTVSFWPLLDLAGVDVYSPLTNHNDPTLPQLLAAWHHDLLGEDMVVTLRNWQAALNQPVLFTEIGYQSAQGTNTSPPYVGLNGAVPDQQEQANCYEAAFETWTQESWLKGMFWWGWSVPVPSSTDADYTARTKLAQGIMKNWYTALNSPPTLASAPTATPADPSILQTVSFSASATDPDGDFVLSTWDFGDATTAAGSTATHAYSAAGTYTVTFTASDGKGGVSSVQLLVRVQGGGPVVGTDPAPVEQTLTQPLKLTRLNLKLDFAHAANDALKLNGTLPLTSIPPDGTPMILNVGGAIHTFTLVSKRNTVFTFAKPHAGNSKFTLNLKSESLAAALASAGLTGDQTIKNKTVSVVFTLVFANVTYQTTRSLKYSARKGISGIAR
jgi:PKD repeat protein